MSGRENHPVHGALARMLSLVDHGRAADAVELVRTLSLDDPNAAQVRGITLIEAGEALQSADAVREGVEILSTAVETPTGISMAYNRANGHLALWMLAVNELGLGAAHALHRTELHSARELFEQVAADDAAFDANTRAQALVNLGNSYDGAGRHVEAIAAYGQALEIVPGFAMALGNRGVTLLYRASLEDVHRPAIGSDAVADLDAALADPEGVLRVGGPEALAHFAAERARIPGTPVHVHVAQPLEDPHQEWCRLHELFLHPSPRCITPETKLLDRLGLGKMLVRIEEREKHKVLQDSLNSLLQDYLAARYLTWAVTEPGTDLRTHAASLGSRASFSDTLTYARWGVGTGLRVIALASATNLLDKIAAVAHQYLRSGVAPRHAYMRNFGVIEKKNKPDSIVQKVGKELDAGNRGLLALCDLAGEIGRQTPLNELVKRRNAATHRTVAVHEMLFEGEQVESDWLDRVEAGALSEALIAQLIRAKAALIYLADAINFRDNRLAGEEPLPSLPSWPAEVEPTDW